MGEGGGEGGGNGGYIIKRERGKEGGRKDGKYLRTRKINTYGLSACVKK